MGKLRKHLTMIEDRSVNAPTDHISELPVPVLQKIMYPLCAKDAAKMSTLSKTWYSAWSSLPYLNFGDIFYEHLPERRNFLNVIDRTLENRQLQKVSIQKFWLKLRGYPLLTAYIHSWIKTLVGSNIKELILRVQPLEMDVYETMSETLFAAKELNVLSLYGFKIEIPSDGIKFLYLRELKLEHTFLDDHFIQAICASCSGLEDLTLSRCHGITNIQIAGTLPKLRRVWLVLVGEVVSVDIVAPNVENIRICCPHKKMLEELRITTCKALKYLFLENVGITDEGLVDILSSLPNLETLSLHSCTAMKEMNISSDRLECLTIWGCSNLIAVELDTANLSRFAYTCLDQLPTFKLKAPILVNVELNLYTHKKSFESDWYSKLVKFLGNFNGCKTIELWYFCEEAIVIPQDMRNNLVPPLYGTDCLYVIFGSGNTSSVVEVLDSLLWMFPKLESISFAQDSNLKYTLKFKYEDGKTCCPSLPLCWRHHKVKAVELENYGRMEQQKFSGYLSHETVQELRDYLLKKFPVPVDIC